MIIDFINKIFIFLHVFKLFVNKIVIIIIIKNKLFKLFVKLYNLKKIIITFIKITNLKCC